MDTTTINKSRENGVIDIPEKDFNKMNINQGEEKQDLEKGLSLNGSSNIEGSPSVIENSVEVIWGFPLQDLYKISLKFYKDKEGKAVHIGYADKTKLVALTQQVTHGTCNPAAVSNVGVFDVVGKDRRLAWQALGSMTKEEAMKNFIDDLNELAPTFKPYVEALLADRIEKERIAKEEEEKRIIDEAKRKEEQEQREKEEEEKKIQEEKKRQIQEALNQQTYEQFRAYAEHWHPGNPEQQAVLILQLQNQHYEQYMQQVYQQQLLLQQQQINGQLSEKSEESPTKTERSQAEEGSDGAEVEETEDNVCTNGHLEYQENGGEEEEDSSIAAASLWTRRDIKEFKDSIRNEGGDSVIKVGHGETVTVRVPTHEDGTRLFWEFATDSYDIGFGVFFEWTNDVGNVVSVHISESEDELDEEEEEDCSEDIERLAGNGSQNESKAPMSLIIPVYRRDCHDEVYAGSHSYPGTGVYLLKFDNSYSLWRSKTLYYRVYYTR